MESNKLQKCKQVFNKWLEFDGDDEILDILFAYVLDRKFKGEPLWLWFIVASGAMKSTLFRALRYGASQYTYGLDSFTSKSLMSGKPTAQDVKGQTATSFLPKINGKVLLIKDLTTILSKDDRERNAIFGQLRSIYDGYYEAHFGELIDKQYCESTFGFIAGVTPIVEIYTKMNQVLGERVLKLRWRGNIEKVTHKASTHKGKEDELKIELQSAVSNFFSGLEIKDIEINNEQYVTRIENMAMFLGEARTTVIPKWNQYGQIVDCKFEPQPEYPTRIVKNLLKLGKILTCIREKPEFTIKELSTLWRITTDSISPYIRWKILNYLYKNPKPTDALKISEDIHEVYAFVKHRLEEMKFLKLVNDIEEEGWVIMHPTLDYLDIIHDKKKE